MPVLRVLHYEDDHSWDFVCGTTDETDDGRTIGMGTALKIDSSLRDIVDLPPGWGGLARSGIAMNWRIHNKSLQSDAATPRR